MTGAGVQRRWASAGGGRVKAVRCMYATGTRGIGSMVQTGHTYGVAPVPGWVSAGTMAHAADCRAKSLRVSPNAVWQTATEGEGAGMNERRAAVRKREGCAKGGSQGRTRAVLCGVRRAPSAQRLGGWRGCGRSAPAPVPVAGAPLADRSLFWIRGALQTGWSMSIQPAASASSQPRRVIIDAYLPHVCCSTSTLLNHHLALRTQSLNSVERFIVASGAE